MNNIFTGNTVTVAQRLLGLELIVKIGQQETGGIITETEAYTQEDPACHAFGGKKTPRNAPMFLAAGHLYVYFIYGMHYCVNIVTEEAGRGCAVLIRSLIPTCGIEQMQIQRGTQIPFKQLANGPAKLVQALNIQPQWSGLNLQTPESPILIRKPRTQISLGPVEAHPRIGIQKGQDYLWRFNRALINS